MYRTILSTLSAKEQADFLFVVIGLKRKEKAEEEIHRMRRTDLYSSRYYIIQSTCQKKTAADYKKWIRGIGGTD